MPEFIYRSQTAVAEWPKFGWRPEMDIKMTALSGIERGNAARSPLIAQD